MVDAVIPEGIDVQEDPVTHGEHAATPDEAVLPDAPAGGSAGSGDEAADTAEAVAEERPPGQEETSADQRGTDASLLGPEGAQEEGALQDALAEPAAAEVATAGDGDSDTLTASGADGAVGAPEAAGVHGAATGDEPDAAGAGPEPDGDTDATRETPAVRAPDLQALHALIDIGSVPVPNTADADADTDSALDQGEEAIWESAMAPDTASGDDGDGPGDRTADGAGAGDDGAAAAAGEDVGAGAAEDEGDDAPHVVPADVDELDEEDDAEDAAPRRAWDDLPPLS